MEKRKRFRLMFKEVDGVRTSKLLYSEKEKRFIKVLLYIDECYFELYDAKTSKIFYRSRKINYRDNLQRELKRELLKLEVDLFDGK